MTRQFKQQHNTTDVELTKLNDTQELSEGAANVATAFSTACDDGTVAIAGVASTGLLPRRRQAIELKDQAGSGVSSEQVANRKFEQETYEAQLALKEELARQALEAKAKAEDDASFKKYVAHHHAKSPFVHIRKELERKFDQRYNAWVSALKVTEYHRTLAALKGEKEIVSFMMKAITMLCANLLQLLNGDGEAGRMFSPFPVEVLMLLVAHMYIVHHHSYLHCIIQDMNQCFETIEKKIYVQKNEQLLQLWKLLMTRAKPQEPIRFTLIVRHLANVLMRVHKNKFIVIKRDYSHIDLKGAVKTFEVSEGGVLISPIFEPFFAFCRVLPQTRCSFYERVMLTMQSNMWFQASYNEHQYWPKKESLKAQLGRLEEFVSQKVRLWVYAQVQIPAYSLQLFKQLLIECITGYLKSPANMEKKRIATQYRILLNADDAQNGQVVTAEEQREARASIGASIERYKDDRKRLGALTRAVDCWLVLDALAAAKGIASSSSVTVAAQAARAGARGGGAEKDDDVSSTAARAQGAQPRLAVATTLS
jgi:hypothetical protein